MKKLLCLLLCLTALLSCSAAQAELMRHSMTETALTLLPEGDPFIRRYNQMTGAKVEASFTLGVPYFFGGQKGWQVFQNWPDYTRCPAWQDSRYYRKGTFYLCGFDCRGFLGWVRQENGQSMVPKLRQMLSDTRLYGQYYLFTSSAKFDLPITDYAEVRQTVRPGDLLVIAHGGTHVMMYIGTMRDFGYTAEDVPKLAEYLDYPLMIHCGDSPVAGDRFQPYIDQAGQLFSTTVTTDGCVQVSILGVPRELADVHANVNNEDFYYFYIDDGSIMTIYSLDDKDAWTFLRLPDHPTGEGKRIEGSN